MPLFFDSQQLPPLGGEYVLWFDGMGTGRTFMSSLKSSAQFIFKLHQAFQMALQDLQLRHRIYPLMDGLYLTSPSRSQLQEILRTALLYLADEFLHHPDSYHQQFLVRGGVAFGATLHGADIPDQAFQKPHPDTEPFAHTAMAHTRDRILISTAMNPAFTAEGLAPPFGVYVDNSALTAPQLVDPDDAGFSSNLWRWWAGHPHATEKARQLAQEILRYLQNAERSTHELGYPIERIHVHQRYAKEYFCEFLHG